MVGEGYSVSSRELSVFGEIVVGRLSGFGRDIFVWVILVWEGYGFLGFIGVMVREIF